MRKIAGKAKKNNTTVMFINQIREKIGVMYGSPNVTTGGNALKFYTSQRIEIKRVGHLKDKEGNVVGNRTKVKVTKNKIARPYQEAEFDIVYGIGIDDISEMVDMAVACKVIDKGGSWYSYGETKLGQGKDNVVALLRDNIELTEEIKKEIKEKRYE
jgi:recombination protein RecA